MGGRTRARHYLQFPGLSRAQNRGALRMSHCRYLRGRKNVKGTLNRHLTRALSGKRLHVPLTTHGVHDREKPSRRLRLARRDQQRKRGNRHKGHGSSQRDSLGNRTSNPEAGEAAGSGAAYYSSDT